MMLIFHLFSSVVFAAIGSASLIDGQPDFEDCIQNQGSCADGFFGFLSHSILEQGFAMQSNQLSASPFLAGRGYFAGVQLSTFPFSPPPENLSGKEENTDFIPVFPKLQFGHRGEKIAAALELTPPVPVKGASALFLGGHVGIRRTVNRSIEVDLGFLRAAAPIAATDEQFEKKEGFNNPENLNNSQFQSRCASRENGCVDTLWMSQISTGYRFRQPVGQKTSLYLQAGLQLSTYRLYVMYDDTTWGVWALQPTLSAGAFLLDTEKSSLAVGGGVSTLGPGQHRERSFGLLNRVECAFSRSF